MNDENNPAKDWALGWIGADPHQPNTVLAVLTNGGMTAELHLYGRGSRAYVIVSFSSTTTAVAARAEAHRFTGAVLDEMVELEHEQGLPCQADTTGPQPGRAFAHGMEWVHVTVTGRDALEVLTPYFGDALEDVFDGPGPGR